MYREQSFQYIAKKFTKDIIDVDDDIDCIVIPYEKVQRTHSEKVHKIKQTG
jgi:hypothetical protein